MSRRDSRSPRLGWPLLYRAGDAAGLVVAWRGLLCLLPLLSATLASLARRFGQPRLSSSGFLATCGRGWRSPAPQGSDKNRTTVAPAREVEGTCTRVLSPVSAFLLFAAAVLLSMAIGWRRADYVMTKGKLSGLSSTVRLQQFFDKRLLTSGFTTASSSLFMAT